MYALLPIENTSSYKLHFNYRLEDIQREIEKRTSYLGKFRRTEQAAHLQDLIAMTKDEQNLLIPFAQSAMADVWDQLRKGCMHLSGLDCEWEEVQDIREVTLNPVVEVDDGVGTVYVSCSDNKVTITGTYTIDKAIDTYVYGNELGIELNLTTMFYINDGQGSQVTNDRIVRLNVPHTNSYYEKGDWVIIPYTVEVKMDQATDYTSEETIVKASIKYVTAKTHNKREPSFEMGDYISIEGKVYRVLENTDINTIDMDKDVEEISNLDISDGIHYRMNIPSRVNKNLIAPLDTAIIEALVNKIIHSWLLLAYPQEAEVYATLYASAASQVYQRCNIFNVTHNKVPRIF